MIPAELRRLDFALQPVGFDQLPGFCAAGLLPAWRSFEQSREAIRRGLAPLRPALSLPGPFAAWLHDFEARPAPSDDEEAERWFREHFLPFKIHSAGSAFFTGYYEPETEGALRPSLEYSEPILSRPADLETFPPDRFPLGEGLSAGRRLGGGALAPFPSRREIEQAPQAISAPLLWVRDAVEAFKIHVQGSARLRIENGTLVRLTYAGRNGRPYTSIGRALVRDGLIPESGMSPEAVYNWVRARGLGPGELGRALLQRNESYIFFRLNEDLQPKEGPIGGGAVPLTPLSSIAIDRRFWPYGLPYWVAAEWRWRTGEKFRRMLIGQDTGAAIVGPARADIFFGAGAEAERRAGEIRHGGELFVLFPRRGLG